jgi:hypothetical protein
MWQGGLCRAMSCIRMEGKRRTYYQPVHPRGSFTKCTLLFDPGPERQFQRWGHSRLPHKALVVFQFTISITLIIGTALVLRQINYAKDRPTGYSRQGLIEVNMRTPALMGHFDALRTDLLATGAFRRWPFPTG